MKSTEKSLTQKDLNTICEYCGDYGREVCSICSIERLRQKLVVRAMKPTFRTLERGVFYFCLLELGVEIERIYGLYSGTLLRPEIVV